MTLKDGKNGKLMVTSHFLLRWGDHDSQVMPRVFQNAHKKLILGILWHKEENSEIDWKKA